jgi:hypothetical protein
VDAPNLASSCNLLHQPIPRWRLDNERFVQAGFDTIQGRAVDFAERLLAGDNLLPQSCKSVILKLPGARTQPRTRHALGFSREECTNISG